VTVCHRRGATPGIQACTSGYRSALLVISPRALGRWRVDTACLAVFTHPSRDWKFEVPHVHPRQQRTFRVVLQKSPDTAWSPDGSPSGLLFVLHGSGVRGLKADKLKTKNHEPVRVSVRPSHHTTGTPATDVTGSSGVSWSIYLRCRGAARRRHRAVHGPRRQHGRCHGRWLGCWLGSTKEQRPHA